MITFLLLDEQQNRFYFPDIECDKLFIEVYGDYWHANPSLYGDEEVLSRGRLAKQIRINDKKRITRIEHLTNKKVIILWEKDLKEKGFSIIDNLFKEDKNNESNF